jgi:hypothetical protein
MLRFTTGGAGRIRMPPRTSHFDCTTIREDANEWTLTVDVHSEVWEVQSVRMLREWIRNRNQKVRTDEVKGSAECVRVEDEGEDDGH